MLCGLRGVALVDQVITPGGNIDATYVAQEKWPEAVLDVAQQGRPGRIAQRGQDRCPVSLAQLRDSHALCLIVQRSDIASLRFALDLTCPRFSVGLEVKGPTE